MPGSEPCQDSILLRMLAYFVDPEAFPGLVEASTLVAGEAGGGDVTRLDVGLDVAQPFRGLAAKVAGPIVVLVLVQVGGYDLVQI